MFQRVSGDGGDGVSRVLAAVGSPLPKPPAVTRDGLAATQRTAGGQPVVYPRGTLAMANAGPGTNGSQFFFVYKDSELPPDYTVFGKVDDEDMGVLDKIAAAGTVDGSPDGKPKIDVVITSARLD
jgi:cyclophilin family peptidyl-prolyl cis-trans isomerase